METNLTGFQLTPPAGRGHLRQILPWKRLDRHCLLPMPCLLLKLTDPLHLCQNHRHLKSSCEYSEKCFQTCLSHVQRLKHHTEDAKYIKCWEVLVPVILIDREGPENFRSLPWKRTEKRPHYSEIASVTGSLLLHDRLLFASASIYVFRPFALIAYITLALWLRKMFNLSLETVLISSERNVSMRIWWRLSTFTTSPLNNIFLTFLQLR